MKKTKGLLAQIIEEGTIDTNNLSPITLQDLEDMFKREVERNNKPNILHVGAGLMLSCTDEQFTILWCNPNTECYCSLDAHKQILERAKKLKLTK